MALILWGRASSANVQKVLWALGEVGAAFEHRPLGGRFGGLDDPSYRKLNPNGLVPTLQDGSVTIWESNTIVRYLAARYGAGRIWPEDPAVRALCDQWTDWTATAFQPAWIGAFWNIVRTPVADHDAARIAASVTATNNCLAILDGALADRDYLAGTFSYADITAGVGLYRWFTMDAKREAAPNVEQWYGRLQQRPEFRRSVMVDYGELVGRTTF